MKKLLAHKLIPFFGFLMFFASCPLPAQTLKGNWYGLLDANGFLLRINLFIDSTDQGYSLIVSSPDQGGLPIPGNAIRYEFPEISFTNTLLRFRYDGMVDASFTRMLGLFEQRDLKTRLVFSRTPVEPPETSIASIMKKYSKQEVYIPMRDGVRLFTSIYTPCDTSGSYPILMMRTPYNIEPGGPSGYNFFLAAYYRYLKENYIMVFQDVRGKFMSEGEFVDVRPYIEDKKSSADIDEASDTYDAVDWLVKNVKHTNGNVGVMGISYPGFYATMAALSGHPAIKAVSPQAPVTNWFIGDDFHHKGAFFLLDAFDFYSGFGRPRPEPTRSGPQGFRYPVEDNYVFFLREPSLKDIKNKYFGDTILFWNDIFRHPDYDAFWKARTPEPYLHDIKPAVMTVGGWFDAEDLWGALHVYQAIEKQNPKTQANCLVMGPWFHSQWATGAAWNLGNIYWGIDASQAFQELEVEFFNHYLKGQEEPPFPEAFIFVTGTNKWESFATWPPEGTEQKSLYFYPQGQLSFSPPVFSKSFDEYVSDPMRPVPYTEDVHLHRTYQYMTDDQRFASRRPDVMVYQTGLLEDDITMAGPIVAHLFVSTTGTDADYVVKLIDVYPDQVEKTQEEAEVKVPLGGYQMLVRAEIMRGRYRNSFEKPEPFSPGKVTEVRFELPDVAHTFRKGHRIMVQVQNSWFPLVNINPQKFVDIYNCQVSDFQKATHRIYHESKYPSQIEVHVLK
jgi:putative CocE/NonD family hydrolase